MKLNFHALAVLLFLSGSAPTARAESPLTFSMGCTSFPDWSDQVKEIKAADSVARVRGYTDEVTVISDEGHHPRAKKDYDLMIFGSIARTKKGHSAAHFKLESHTTGEFKRLVVRNFKGKKITWFDGKTSEAELPVGKKVLVWAGSKGPDSLWTGKFPEWADLVRSPKGEFKTLVAKDTGSMSEGGTIYYFPEGVLEIFTPKEALVKEYKPRRIYLWGGGCIENVYPTPWPQAE